MATLIEAILTFVWTSHECDQSGNPFSIDAYAMATDAKESLSVRNFVNILPIIILFAYPIPSKLNGIQGFTHWVVRLADAFRILQVDYPVCTIILGCKLESLENPTAPIYIDKPIVKIEAEPIIKAWLECL